MSAENGIGPLSDSKRLRLVLDVPEFAAWGETPESCAAKLLSAWGEYGVSAKIIEAEWADAE